MNTFNRNIQNISPSASMVVMAKAKKLKAIDPEIVDMGGGEPDFDTPKKICDELFKQIQAGYTHYTVGPGLPELCCLRHDYVEGCKTSPVGYLEGISIHEEYRHQGIARKLVSECEQWAREKGCSEFASDCELTNISSWNFHLSVGFQEENRIICFRKTL